MIEFVGTDMFPGGWEEEEEPKHLDHLWAIGVIMHHMVCGQPETWGDADKEEFCRNTNLGTRQTTRELVKDNTNLFSPNNWSKLRNSAKKLIKDLTNFNPGNRPFLCELTTGSWGDYIREASGCWDNNWPFEEEPISSRRYQQSKKTSHIKVTRQNRNKHVKQSASVPPQKKRLNKEWTIFFSKAQKQSRRKKRNVLKLKKERENEERKIEENQIKEWHRLYCKRNNSRKDFDKFNAAAIDPPPGAWETLDPSLMSWQRHLHAHGEVL